MAMILEFPKANRRFHPATAKVQHIREDGVVEEFLFKNCTDAVTFLKKSGWPSNSARIIAF